jgi:hypothetical protein
MSRDKKFSLMLTKVSKKSLEIVDDRNLEGLYQNIEED